MPALCSLKAASRTPEYDAEYDAERDASSASGGARERRRHRRARGSSHALLCSLALSSASRKNAAGAAP